MPISYSTLYSTPVACLLVWNLDMSTFVKSTQIVPTFVIPSELSIFILSKADRIGHTSVVYTLGR